MKKTPWPSIFFLGIAAVAWSCAVSPSVRAEDVSAYSAASLKPAVTSPQYIAMTFAKLSGQKPDFDGWADSTQVYQSASSFDRLAVHDAQVQEMKGLYSLLTLQEPLIVEMPVAVSPYSVSGHGFFVENFKESTFFPVQYAGQSYAIVPQGIVDKQWLKASGDVAKAIDAAAGPERHMTMLIYLMPRYADKSAPAMIGDAEYWLMSADIKKMMLYAKDGENPLWQSEEPVVVDTTHNELLKLRQ